MSKKCPQCGFNESDDAKVCHICGGPLVEEYNFSNNEAPSAFEPINNNNKVGDDDFDYDFGASADATDGAGFNSMSFQVPQQPEGIPLTISDGKANKLKKTLYSWSSSLLALCVMRFIFTFISLSDISEINEMLPAFLNTIYYDSLNISVKLYYAAIVVLVLFLVAAIALMIFSSKVNRHLFPVQDDSVFEDSKKAFFASIATVVVVVAYFAVEIIALVNNFQMQELFGEQLMSFGETAAATIVDVMMVAGSVLCMVCALKLSKCKRV